jgi:hypothetical protein
LKTLADYEQFAKDEGEECIDGIVSFTSQKAANDFADKATRKQFPVWTQKTEEAGRIFFNVQYIG